MGRFCRYCGCEILGDDDLGFEDVETETVMVMPGVIVRAERSFHVCRACVEEAEREL